MGRDSGRIEATQVGGSMVLGSNLTYKDQTKTEEALELAQELHGWLRGCTSSGITCLYCETMASYQVVVRNEHE